SMSAELAALPEGQRHLAGESIAGTMAVADRLGPAGQGLVGPAHAAFVDAMHIGAGVSAVIALLGALVVARWLPGKSSTDTAGATTPAAEPEPARV
ncbi:MAG: MFS transporter, partial [Actinomadura sp.]